MKKIFTIGFLLFTLVGLAQSTISGKVIDENGEALIGANVYIENAYDGETTDFKGQFIFDTFETGSQIIVVSFVGYETIIERIEIPVPQPLNFQLKPAFNAMDAVTVTAGSLEAGDEKKGVVLKSLDIAMTAGASADITNALTTLPGTQKVAESGKLFVRGGDSREVKMFVDGVEVSNFYATKAPGLPTRSRFSPFLFKGSFFSTGGYSAEYGQALSSVLSMTSTDPDPESSVKLSFLSVGVSAEVNQAWENQAFYASIGVTNLKPYNSLINQRYDWITPVNSGDAVLAYKKKTENGGHINSMVMIYDGGFELNRHTVLNDTGHDHIKIENQNLYMNVNADQPIGDKGVFFIGGSFGYNKDNLRQNDQSLLEPVSDMHFKMKYFHGFTEKTTLNTGFETFGRWYEAEMHDGVDNYDADFQRFNIAAFGELAHYVSEQWLIKGGLRAEANTLLNTMTLAPRLSLAHKLTDQDQVSVAAGLFYQDPDNDFIRFDDQLKQENAKHIIGNYEHHSDDQIFRVEGFLKQYEHLLTYDDQYDPTSYRNDGSGYAYGFELFWRDRQGFKGLDYWVSYSWLNSERKYLGFPEKVTPSFASAHNLSIVTKKYIRPLKSQLGLTYSFSSGRPYEDPNKAGFMESKSLVYHDVSFNIAYLPRPNVIVYFSVTNVPGFDQQFGKSYADNPSENGFYASEVNKLPAKRFLVLGCFITIGTDSKRALENL